MIDVNEKPLPEIEFEYGQITAEKILRGVWMAKVDVIKPLKSTLTMKGISKDDAITKLENFLKS